MKHSHRISEICNCRYCLAQISKSRRLESNNSNIYCPKLLFSNEETKIFKALSDLFLNPSNQLRLFVDSSKIQNLRYVFLGFFRYFIVLLYSQYSSEIIPILTKIIAFDPFFQKFIELQCSLLDGISIDEIKPEDLNEELYKSDINSLARKETFNLDEIPAYLKVLITMSIRDSSFIISFASHASEVFRNTIQCGTINYNYKIDIIDLDIKPIEKLEKYISEIKIHG